jgi:hypothetical protein
MFGNKTNSLNWIAGLAIVSASFLANVTSAADEDPQALLERMSAEISGLNSFVLRGELYSDARLEEGLLIEHASEVTMRVRRPDAMRLTISTQENVKELYFGEGMLTFYNGLDNLYAQTDAPGGIAETADFAVHKVGIDAPLLDFLSTSLAARLQEDAQEVQYLGPSLIRGQRYHHIAIRLPEIDVQIWVASKGRPLPGKMALSSKWEGGAPRTVMFFDWDTAPEFPSGKLEFTPPKDSSEIEFVLDN